jgi:predicted O-linked N-acetylglucosamine transferase (SPINDLY family)
LKKSGPSSKQASNGLAQALGQAISAFQANNFEEAYRLCDLVLKQDKGNVVALHLSGILNALRRDFPNALKLLDRALTLSPHNPDLYVDKGKILNEIGQSDAALLCFDKALAINERHPIALELKASLLLLLKRPADTLGIFDRLLQIAPNNGRALNNRGLALTELGRYDDAIESFRLATASDSKNPEIWVNLGNVLCRSKSYSDALAAYSNALTINPVFAEAWLGRGNALASLKQYEDALSASDKALANKPDLAEAWDLRGGIYAKLRRPEASVLAYSEAMREDQQLQFVKGHLLHQKMLCCDWSNVESIIADIEADIQLNRPSAEPFGLLGIASSEQSLQQAAQLCGARLYPGVPMADTTNRSAASTDRKIRVGYLSGEFRVHAISQLLTGVLEEHDRNGFEVSILDNGWDDKSDLRRRIVAAANEVIDITTLSDTAAVDTIRKAGIDILVNINGYLDDHRMGIFARRAAPIQVNYLGFPGTFGCDYIDYIIADRFVIPEDRSSFYTEKVVRLPHCYQPNDSTKKIGTTAFQRGELGLPENGFVFCCFNNNYKIVPGVFDCWARILKRIDGSVLWLLKSNAVAASNLVKEAVARGISPDRLVFADRMPLADHLARHHSAGLFLDTLPYNAHTTASDALWTGLPVLTQTGTTFPGRVATSLLNAVGLPELVVRTQEEYEETAIRLATHPDELALLKDKLLKNKPAAPLFNTRQYARHIEAAFRAMSDRRKQGLDPDHISIPN